MLCDNEVDRDYECFTRGALEKLAVLFEGKTGLLDHERTSRGQSARIYAAQVKDFFRKSGPRGEPYAQHGAGVRAAEKCGDGGLYRSRSRAASAREVSVGARSQAHVLGLRRGGLRAPAQAALRRGALRAHSRQPTDAYEFFVRRGAGPARGGRCEALFRHAGEQGRIGSVGALLKARSKQGTRPRHWTAA